jgi:hypothetical protein
VNWGRRNGEVDVPSFAGKIFWGAFREMEQNLEGGRLAEGLAAVKLVVLGQLRENIKCQEEI